MLFISRRARGSVLRRRSPGWESSLIVGVLLTVTVLDWGSGTVVSRAGRCRTMSWALRVILLVVPLDWRASLVLRLLSVSNPCTVDRWHGLLDRRYIIVVSILRILVRVRRGAVAATFRNSGYE
jgi:hypothetical protein